MENSCQQQNQPPTSALAVEREDFSAELFHNRLAFVLHNVLSPAECASVVRAAEKVGFKPATVRTGFKTEERRLDHRVGDNCYLTDTSIRETLFQRVKAHLPAEFRFGQLVGLNDRMTVLRYRPGGFFGEHMDGTYIAPDDSKISFITVQLYLNDGFDGGETTFFPDGPLRGGASSAETRRRVAVTPRTGSAVVFEHKILHEGSLLRSGEKFTLRADVMYSRYYPPADEAAVGVQPGDGDRVSCSVSATESSSTNAWSRCAVQ